MLTSNHNFLGGILFKTYIVGDIIRVVRRFSLPDIEEHDILNHSGVFNFPRVSCAAASADDTDLSPSIAGEEIYHIILCHIYKLRIRNKRMWGGTISPDLSSL